MSAPGTDLNTEIKNIFNTLFSKLALDVGAIAKQDLLASAASIKSNPTVQNLGAQGLLLQAKLILSGPALEQEGIGQLGDAITSFANLLPG